MESATIEGKASDDLNPVGKAEVLEFGVVGNFRSIFDQIVCDGAGKMLQAALKDEVNLFLDSQDVLRQSKRCVGCRTTAVRCTLRTWECNPYS
jgi:coenzyme F420-reducing hydrogenase gamma subunit